MARAAAALPRRSDGAAAGGRRHRDERQDHDDVPGPRTCSRPPGGRAGCWGRSTSVVAARSARSCARRRRRSTSRPRSGRCSTAATAACAMEVSSHALELRRVDGIHFAVAAFTNLSQDHLDFHPSMEAYFEAKRRLFEEFDVGTAIVDVDDPWGRRLADELAGRGDGALDADADWRAPGRARRRSAGTAFTVRGPAARRRGAAAARAASTRPTRWWALAAGARAGADARRDGGALARAPARCRGACRRRRGPGLRGARRLLAQAGGARERAGGGARARRRAA